MPKSSRNASAKDDDSVDTGGTYVSADSYQVFADDTERRQSKLSELFPDVDPTVSNYYSQQLRRAERTYNQQRYSPQESSEQSSSLQTSSSFPTTDESDDKDTVSNKKTLKKSGSKRSDKDMVDDDGRKKKKSKKRRGRSMDSSRSSLSKKRSSDKKKKRRKRRDRDRASSSDIIAEHGFAAAPGFADPPLPQDSSSFVSPGMNYDYNVMNGLQTTSTMTMNMQNMMPMSPSPVPINVPLSVQQMLGVMPMNNNVNMGPDYSMPLNTLNMSPMPPLPGVSHAGDMNSFGIQALANPQPFPEFPGYAGKSLAEVNQMLSDLNKKIEGFGKGKGKGAKGGGRGKGSASPDKRSRKFSVTADGFGTYEQFKPKDADKFDVLHFNVPLAPLVAWNPNYPNEPLLTKEGTTVFDTNNQPVPAQYVQRRMQDSRTSMRVVDDPDKPADRWIMLTDVPFGTEQMDLEKAFTLRFRASPNWERDLKVIDDSRLFMMQRLIQKPAEKGDTGLTMACEFCCDELGRLAFTLDNFYTDEHLDEMITISRPSTKAFMDLVPGHEDAKTLETVEEKFGKYFGYLARCEEKFCTTLKN